MGHRLRRSFVRHFLPFLRRRDSRKKRKGRREEEERGGWVGGRGISDFLLLEHKLLLDWLAWFGGGGREGRKDYSRMKKEGEEGEGGGILGLLLQRGEDSWRRVGERTMQSEKGCDSVASPPRVLCLPSTQASPPPPSPYYTTVVRTSLHHIGQSVKSFPPPFFPLRSSLAASASAIYHPSSSPLGPNPSPERRRRHESNRRESGR